MLSICLALGIASVHEVFLCEIASNDSFCTYTLHMLTQTAILGIGALDECL